MKKKTVATIIGSAAVGAGLGILFAPKSGKETREDLKKKMNELREKVNKMHIGDIQEYVNKKMNKIENQLAELDQEKVLKLAKVKAKKIEKECKRLAKFVKDKSEPILMETVESIHEKAMEVTREVLNKLEEK